MFGTGSDMRMYHDGNHANIENTEGEFRIRQNTGGNMVLNSNGRVLIQVSDGEDAVYCDNDGSVKLYHNGAETFKTTSEGATFDTNSSSCVVRLTSNTDAVSLLQGFNSDLNIKAPTGGALILQSNGNEDAVKCVANGAVELYHDATKRVETFDLGLDLLNATGNIGIRWGGANFNYCNIWAEYGSGDLFLAGGLKPKTTNAGFFSSYGNSAFSRNAIQIDAFGNEGIHFYSSGTQTVATDSTITVPERVRINQHGLTFNGDSAAANALDDYEEGQYTPAVTGDSGQTDVSIYGGENKLNYTKIGNLVNISGRIRMQTVAYNGGLRITLPFTAESNTNTSNASMAAVATHGADFDSTAGTGSHMGMFLEVGGGTAYAYFVVTRDNSAWIGANNTIIKANTYLTFTYTYRAG